MPACLAALLKWQKPIHAYLTAQHVKIYDHQSKAGFKQHIIYVPMQVGRTVNKISMVYMTWPKILKLV